MEKKHLCYDMLVKYGVTEEFISGAIAIGGYNMETLERVLYYKFGYSTFEQMAEDMADDEHIGQF